jgi:transposase InsO family protein
MREHKNQYNIRETVNVFRVPASAYYKWAKRGPSQKRSAEDAALPGLIREIVTKHHWRYGSPQVREALRNACGKRTSLKKVARLTREHGLNARLRGKRVPSASSSHGLPTCENLLNREFQAETAGVKWVPDITYPRVLDGWIYQTVVLYLYDRKVIGWAFSDGLETARTAIPALRRAWCFIPAGGRGIAQTVFVMF